MNLQRRQVFKSLFGLSLLGFGLGRFLVACSGSSVASNGAVAGGNCSANGTNVSIGLNHGHTIPVIDATDINTHAGGASLPYTLGIGTTLTDDGIAHSHTITVTGADFTTLEGNTGVLVTTDADATGHSHQVTINCA